MASLLLTTSAANDQYFAGTRAGDSVLRSSQTIYFGTNNNVVAMLVTDQGVLRVPRPNSADYFDVGEEIDKLVSGQVALQDGSVGTSQIVDGAVTGAKLAAGAVTTSNIVGLNVTTAKLADGAVTTAKLADFDVTGAKLAAGAVTTSNIVGLNVTTEKLADGAVTTAKLGDGEVTTDKLGDGAVTEDKLADGAVTTDKLYDGAVTTAKLDDESVTADKISGPVPVAIGGTGAGTLQGTSVLYVNGAGTEVLGDRAVAAVSVSRSALAVRNLDVGDVGYATDPAVSTGTRYSFSTDPATGDLTLTKHVNGTEVWQIDFEKLKDLLDCASITK
jgi:hypothetical protein